MTIVYRQGHGIVSKPIPGIRKSVWLRKFTGLPAQARISPALTYYTLTSEGYASGPAGSHSFHTYGTTQDAHSCPTWSLECSAYFKNSSSYSDWLGLSPYNANMITASMKWWLSGLDVSVGIPGGPSFQKVGSGLLWEPPGVTNTWLESLSWSSTITMTAVVISGQYFTDQADILIGSHWYHVQGD